MSESYIIPIRTNLYLWLLTGRSNNFLNDTLNTGINYSVSFTPPEVEAVRELLKLDVTDTDFHALAALAAAKTSTAFIRHLPHENDMVFVKGFLSLPPIASTHTLLSPDGNSWPSVDGGFAGANGFSSITFRNAGSGKVEVTTNGAFRGESTYAVFTEDGGTLRVVIADAPRFGIRANFRATTWAENEEIAVTLSPTRYPFKAVAAAARASGAARRLMAETGTLPAFSETSNPARQVGMVALAVIRRMVDVMNDEQSGFQVTAERLPDGSQPLTKLYEVETVFTAPPTDTAVTADEPPGFHA